MFSWAATCAETITASPSFFGVVGFICAFVVLEQNWIISMELKRITAIIFFIVTPKKVLLLF
jgi:hypothetical protein